MATSAATVSPAPSKRNAESGDAAQVALLVRRVREVTLEAGAALRISDQIPTPPE